MGGSLDKRTLLILAVVLGSIAIGCAIWYYFLPQAMSKSAFQRLLDLSLNQSLSNLQYRSELARDRHMATELKCGSIRDVVSTKLHDPKATYPTLQATAIVLREKCKCNESYTFTVDDEGRLILVGMTSAKVNK